MTAAIFRPEAIIPEESFNPERLAGIELVDFLSINPKTAMGNRNYGTLRDLRTWQAHFRQAGTPFAVCKHKSNRWKLFKPLRVPYQQKKQHYTSDIKSVFGEMTRCTCPQCGKTHRQVMLWTGRGVPRCYCPQCQANVSSYSGGVDDNYAFHQQSIRQGR